MLSIRAFLAKNTIVSCLQMTWRQTKMGSVVYREGRGVTTDCALRHTCDTLDFLKEETIQGEEDKTNVTRY